MLASRMELIPTIGRNGGDRAVCGKAGDASGCSQQPHAAGSWRRLRTGRGQESDGRSETEGEEFAMAHGQRLGPRLTTRLTLPRFGSTVPGLGFCEITRPFLTIFE